MKANEVSASKKAAWRREFLVSFRGFGSAEPTNDDYWHPFLLGLFELATYPVLMATEHWTFVGAWLAFKTVAQFKRWEHRAPYNRFLIGTALVLLASYGLSALFVTSQSR